MRFGQNHQKQRENDAGIIFAIPTSTAGVIMRRFREF